MEKRVEKIESLNDLKLCKEGYQLMDNNDIFLVDLMGLDNIIRFEEENHLFFIKQGDISIWEYFNERKFFFNDRTLRNKFRQVKTDDDFNEAISYMLAEFRKNKYFGRSFLEKEIFSYHIIDGVFKSKYPKLFISDKASFKVRKAFYENDGLLDIISRSPKDMKYFYDKDILEVFEIDIPFYQKYLATYGKEKLVNLIKNYGPMLKNIDIPDNIDNIDYEEVILENTYLYIKYNKCDYTYLYKNKSFRNKYPQIFLDFEKFGVDKITKKEIMNILKNGDLSFKDVAKYPILKELLIGKDLTILFGKEAYISYKYAKILQKKPILESILNCITDKEFLDICEIYQEYLGYILRDIVTRFNFQGDYTYEGLRNLLDDNLYEQILNGLVYDKKVRNISDKFKNVSLDAEASLELQRVFYGERGLNFKKLGNYLKDERYRSYLEDKDLRPLIIRSHLNPTENIKLFLTLGYQDTMSIGLKYPKLVDRLLNENNANLLLKWYLGLDKKYLPGYSVMVALENDIPLFKKNEKKWSNLVKICNVSVLDDDMMDGFIKLSYAFGIFHGDDRGYNLLIKLFSLPNISKKYNLQMQSFLNYFNPEFKDVLPNSIAIAKLKLIFIKNGYPFLDDKNNMLEIYNLCKDGGYRLDSKCYNWQDLTDIKDIMADFNLPVLNTSCLHNLCGGFKLEYHPAFKEFFIDNLEKIQASDDIKACIGLIQTQFSEIYTFNKNRKLTLERALNYIYTKNYQHIEVGNDKLATWAMRIGYSETNFMTLQRMYAMTKKRTFSTIPEVFGSAYGYTYKTLRLDDALGFVVGELTNCCQRIGDLAEVSMEHAMTSNNGKIFVVYNKLGELVAQSWVWRNGNMLCFDNVEVPWNFIRKHLDKGLLELYKVYLVGANEFIKQDKIGYAKALEEGLIDEAKAHQLVLSKVTMGTGNNDLNLDCDDITVKDPFPRFLGHYKPMANMPHYIYTDSDSQVILAGNNDNLYCGTALKLYCDTVVEKDTLEHSEIKMLQDLERVTNGNVRIPSSIEDLKRWYCFHNLKVILTPNIGIIYDDYNDKIILGDIFINTVVNTEPKKSEEFMVEEWNSTGYKNYDSKYITYDLPSNIDITEEVLIQLKNIIDVIEVNKLIDASKLDNISLDIYNKIKRQENSLKRVNNLDKRSIDK